jgi:hypothetical protein
MDVKRETTKATTGGRKTKVFTPETGNSMNKAFSNSMILPLFSGSTQARRAAAHDRGGIRRHPMLPLPVKQPGYEKLAEREARKSSVAHPMLRGIAPANS